MKRLVKKRPIKRKPVKRQIQKTEPDFPESSVSGRAPKPSSKELVTIIRESLETTFQEVWTNPDEGQVNYMDEVARGVVRLLEYGHLDSGVYLTQSLRPLVRIREHSYDPPTCQACQEKP
jgi:hypothetical protein